MMMMIIFVSMMMMMMMIFPTESNNKFQQIRKFITCHLNTVQTSFGHPHAHHQELQQL
jgi:hypothetical protein